MNLQKIYAQSKIIKYIRAWFDAHGFEEMHVPRMVALPGQEPHLDPFWTEIIEIDGSTHPAALITSPEYAMKKLLSAGCEKIYDLGPCFRNKEPRDSTHSSEFMMLEWYRRDAEIDTIMQDTEKMVMDIAKSYGIIPEILKKPWRKITVVDAWKKYIDIDLILLLENREAIAEVASRLEQTISESDSWEDIYFKIFLTYIEPRLGIEQPTFLYEYPKCMAALARTTKNDNRFADRVELYIGEVEFANGFAELSDPVEQRKRFEEERELRNKLGKKIWDIDEEFLSCLPCMGNAAGIAFGVDRLIMLLTQIGL